MLCEIAFRNVRARNLIVEEDQLSKWRKQAQEEEVELYRSLYSFDDEIIKHMRTHKTIRGYRGKLFLRAILLDVDKGTNSDEHTYRRVLGIVDRAILDHAIPEEAITVSFSGTGYHITFPDVFHFGPSVDPRVVARTLLQYFPGIDDIYTNPTRLIRVTGTLNMKSHLFKVPFTVEEFRSFDWNEIQNLAKEPRESKTTPLTKPLPTLKIPEDQPVAALIAPGRLSEQFVTCMQTLYNRGEQEGSRHNDVLRLASVYRRGGVPQEGTSLILQRWAKSLDPYVVDNAVHDVYKNGFEWGCNDEILKQYCSEKCVFFKHKNLKIDYASSATMEESFKKYILTERESRSVNFQEALGLSQPFKCEPGEVVIFWGDTGIGKTALVQNLVIQFVHMPILYVSLEIGQNLVYRRFVQIAHGLSKEEVLNHYTVSENTYGKALSHIAVSTVARDPTALLRVISATQARLVVIDTLDGLDSTNLDPNTRGEELMKILTGIAIERQIIIFIVHHISKASGKELASGERLNLHSGKGASSIEQKGDKVIAVEAWPSRFHRSVRTLKSRDEDPFEAIMFFDPITFRYIPAHNLPDISDHDQQQGGEWITLKKPPENILPLKA